MLWWSSSNVSGSQSKPRIIRRRRRGGPSARAVKVPLIGVVLVLTIIGLYWIVVLVLSYQLENAQPFSTNTVLDAINKGLLGTRGTGSRERIDVAVGKKVRTKQTQQRKTEMQQRDKPAINSAAKKLDIVETIKQGEWKASQSADGQTVVACRNRAADPITSASRLEHPLLAADLVYCSSMDSNGFRLGVFKSIAGKNDGLVFYYNSLQRDRYVCGTKLEPESGQWLEASCSNDDEKPVGLFPVTPNTTGQGLPPVQLHFGSSKSRGARFDDCDIPCYSSGAAGIYTTRYVDAIHDHRVQWSIVFSMEGEKYYSGLKIQPLDYQQDHFYSTTSYLSEVPLPYYSEAEYKIQSPPVDFDKGIKGALFLAHNCHSNNNREEVVKTLMNYPGLRVDSLSSCLRNAGLPSGVQDLRNKRNVMQQYLLYLSFENQNVDDYITEKLWGALEAGTLPVYMGAPNIADHAPNRSIISVADFGSTKELAEYLVKVLDDRELYMSYHEWRNQPLPPHFHRRYDWTKVHGTCRTCRWAYARLYGMGWDHWKQSLRELHTPRHVCTSPQNGKINQPFTETWLSTDPNDAAAETVLTMEPVKSDSGSVSLDSSSQNCFPLTKANRMALVSGSGQTIQRTVYDDDNVIDIFLRLTGPQKSDSPNSIVLRMTLPIESSSSDDVQSKEIEPGHHRIQNAKTRFTVLSSPAMPIQNLDTTSRTSVAVDITVIDNSQTTDPVPMPFKIRVIVEDVDDFHQGADEVENYFGKLMVDDFMYPVEGFVVEKK